MFTDFKVLAGAASHSDEQHDSTGVVDVALDPISMSLTAIEDIANDDDIEQPIEPQASDELTVSEEGLQTSVIDTKDAAATQGPTYADLWNNQKVAIFPTNTNVYTAHIIHEPVPKTCHYAITLLGNLTSEQSITIELFGSSLGELNCFALCTAIEDCKGTVHVNLALNRILDMLIALSADTFTICGGTLMICPLQVVEWGSVAETEYTLEVSKAHVQNIFDMLVERKVITEDEAKLTLEESKIFGITAKELAERMPDAIPANDGPSKGTGNLATTPLDEM